MKRFVVVWTVVALGIWFFAAAATAESEERCERADAFICFTFEDTLLIAGIYVGAIWLFGLFVAGVVAGLRWWHRKLTET